MFDNGPGWVSAVKQGSSSSLQQHITVFSTEQIRFIATRSTNDHTNDFETVLIGLDVRVWLSRGIRSLRILSESIGFQATKGHRLPDTTESPLITSLAYSRQKGIRSKYS